MSEAVLSAQAIPQETQQTKEWTPAKVIYAFLMTFSLLSHFWLLATHTGINMPIYIWIPRIAAASLAIYLGKLWKDRGFRILAIYTLLFSARALIPNPANVFTDDISESILSALWLFAGCYGMAKILNVSQLKRYLMTNSVIWIIGMAVLCCVGIYTAWTEQSVKLLGGNIDLHIDPNNSGVKRLELVYLPTVSGAIMSITVLIGTISALCKKNQFCKIALILTLIPVILAMALTDSRTAFISISIGLAIMSFTGVYQYCQKRSKEKEIHKKINQWRSWVFGILVMTIVFLLTIIIILQLTPAFNRIRTQGVISRALAEDEKPNIAARGFTGDNVLSSRSILWTEIFRYIDQNRLILFDGISKKTALAKIDNNFGHCHCLYIQVLLESGIPGLILILTFIVYTTINAIRTITNPDLPIWIRLLPAVFVSLVVADVVECFLWLRTSYAPMITVFFISVGIFNTLVSSSKTNKTKAYCQQ